MELQDSKFLFCGSSFEKPQVQVKVWLNKTLLIQLWDCILLQPPAAELAGCQEMLEIHHAVIQSAESF